MKKPRLPVKCEDQYGQSTVEFSMVLIILMFTVALIASVAPIVYNWTILQYAAHEAARYGSLGKIDPEFTTREDSIRARIFDVTGNLGVPDVEVTFEDQFGSATAGGPSEFFRVKIFKTLELRGLLPGMFHLLKMNPSESFSYQVAAWTVIRNEPF